MRSITVSRPSMTSIIAVLALFLSIGGTGYAAATLSGKSLKKRSVPADRIVRNSLTGTQINEQRLGIVPRSLTADRAGVAQAAKQADAATAAETANTAKAADTAKVADDAKQLGGRPPSAYLASATRIAVAETSNVATGDGRTVAATCEAGEQAVSGGGAWVLPGGNALTLLDAQLISSLPVADAADPQRIAGWRVAGRNQTGSDRILRAFAVCVPRIA